MGEGQATGLSVAGWSLAGWGARREKTVNTSKVRMYSFSPVLIYPLVYVSLGGRTVWSGHCMSISKLTARAP